MAAKKTTKQATASNPVPVPEVQLGELKTVLLTDVDAQSYENQRSGNWMLGDAKDYQNDNSFQELVDSIRETGQKDPVTVRVQTKSKKLQLIKGFRRYAALRRLAELNGTSKTATINVIVKDLDDLQAFEEHVLENTARDNLKGPDLAFAAYRMQQLHRNRGVNLSGNVIAQRMGKNQSYIAQLLRIIEKAPEVAALWRDAPIALSTNEMDRIAKLADPAQQKGEYTRLLKDASEDDPNAWVKTACDKVAKTATLIGTLEREGLIAEVEIAWDEKLGPLGVTVKEGATMSQISAIAKAAREAYAIAKNPPEPKPKGKKARKAESAETSE